MSQLRLDPLTGRWIVISTERRHRPFSFVPRSLPVEGEPGRPCPFCPDQQRLETHPTLEVDGPDGAWLVRVLPNLYPALEGHDPMVVDNVGPVFMEAPGSGIHEVVVVSPDHRVGWADLSDAHSCAVMGAIRDRTVAHTTTPGLRYTQAIVNAGREAGASLEHPHGQLLGMPFVPREVTDEQAGFARFSGNCLLCATIEAEDAAGSRVVYADDAVLVVCPFWSGTPFEMLVLPRTHEPHLHHAGEVDLAAVGKALQRSLASLRWQLGDLAYNVVFHSAPYKTAGDFHWHAHVLPKAATRAGFEMGTGVLINVVPPETAASELRSAVAAA